MLENGNPLPKLKEIIDFEQFRDILEPVFDNTEKKNNAGRKPIKSMFMFKVLFLQRLYGMSDAQIEYHTKDRTSFRDFLDIKAWTLNIEYFSEIMHLMHIQSNYGRLYDKLIEYDPSDMRDFTAIKRIATAYMKLLFPHWVEEKDVSLEGFDIYCLQPAFSRDVLSSSNASSSTPNISLGCLTSM